MKKYSVIQATSVHTNEVLGTGLPARKAVEMFLYHRSGIADPGTIVILEQGEDDYRFAEELMSATLASGQGFDEDQEALVKELQARGLPRDLARLLVRAADRDTDEVCPADVTDLGEYLCILAGVSSPTLAKKADEWRETMFGMCPKVFYEVATVLLPVRMKENVHWVEPQRVEEPVWNIFAVRNVPPFAGHAWWRSVEDRKVDGYVAILERDGYEPQPVVGIHHEPIDTLYSWAEVQKKYPGAQNE